MYKFVGKTIISMNNIVTNCLAKEGSIYYLENTDFIDTGSIFEYNGAVRGGVAYCKNCKMHFKGSRFNGNFA